MVLPSHRIQLKIYIYGRRSNKLVNIFIKIAIFFSFKTTCFMNSFHIHIIKLINIYLIYLSLKK